MKNKFRVYNKIEREHLPNYSSVILTQTGDIFIKDNNEYIEKIL